MISIKRQLKTNMKTQYTDECFISLTFIDGMDTD